MRLYLVQHGKSLPEAVDPKRPLSNEGKIQTEKVAQFLKTKKIKIDKIWHSDKLRAIQTAQIIAKHIKDAQVRERDDIKPTSPVESLAQEITNTHAELMIVGHLPYLQKLAALLLRSQNEEIILFCYSGIVCMERAENWKIAWIVVSDLL